jgi:hypothetical protein
MSLKDILMGSKPSYELLPGMQDSINGIQGLDFNTPGFLHRNAKSQLKRLNRGDDVSDMGEFAALRQQEATDLAGIDEDFSVGANVLNASGGGDQASQLAALQQRFKERRREGTGRQYVQALGDLRNSATNTLSSENARRDDNLLRQQQLLMQARSNVGRNERTGGILPGLIQGAAQVGSAALLACWVAKELYSDDWRVDVVRSYIYQQAETSLFWFAFLSLYLAYGERFATYIKTHKRTRKITKFIFDRILTKAQRHQLWAV